MNDMVNKPNHYMLFADGTEALDIIRSSLTREEYIGYCKGNVLKYRLRAGKKDTLEQDIAKANTYAAYLGRALHADPADAIVTTTLSGPHPPSLDEQEEAMKAELRDFSHSRTKAALSTCPHGGCSGCKG